MARAFNAIQPYSVGPIGRGYGVFLRGQIISDEHDCRAAAVYAAHDLLDAEEDASEIEAEDARRVEAELRADAAAILAQIGEAA